MIVQFPMIPFVAAGTVPLFLSKHLVGGALVRRIPHVIRSSQILQGE
jgi:hypothetical protein